MVEHDASGTKPRVYVETSVVSLLTARPSRDAVTLGHQIATHEWWDLAVNRCELVVSPLVIDEASAEDPEATRARLTALESVSEIPAGEDAKELGRVLIGAGALPKTAETATTHVALAAVNGARFLVTWNMRHLANPVAAARIRQACSGAGHDPPVICTPSQHMEMAGWNRQPDPILDELRRVKAAIAARHSHDVGAIIRDAETRYLASGGTFLDPAETRPDSAGAPKDEPHRND